jgi:curved DNA-binding protein CbpA
MPAESEDQQELCVLYYDFEVKTKLRILGFDTKTFTSMLYNQSSYASQFPGHDLSGPMYNYISIGDLKNAYKAKALLYHPDSGLISANAEAFNEISQAFQGLMTQHAENMRANAAEADTLSSTKDSSSVLAHEARATTQDSSSPVVEGYGRTTTSAIDRLLDSQPNNASGTPLRVEADKSVKSFAAELEGGNPSPKNSKTNSDAKSEQPKSSASFFSHPLTMSEKLEEHYKMPRCSQVERNRKRYMTRYDMALARRESEAFFDFILTLVCLAIAIVASLHRMQEDKAAEERDKVLREQWKSEFHAAVGIRPPVLVASPTRDTLPLTNPQVA